jgi:hypothetical protein
MIIFGTAITDPLKYDRWASAGIQRVREPDSKVFAHQTTGSLFRNYNLMLDLAREQSDLEALVLMHQDAELTDPDFCSKIREELEDPDVAIVGCVGAVGVRSIAWWEGAVTWASFTHRYEELGGGEVTAMTYNERQIPSFAEIGEVDSIDGFIMALSPWAVHNLRFDESLGKLHGYDYDLCCQARAAGKKVMTADFRAVHHHSLNLVGEPSTWTEAYIRLAEKWDGVVDIGTEDWRARALRSEAEAALAKLIAESTDLKYRAAMSLLERVEKSPSWRLTKPLRAAKRLFRRPD